MSVSRLMTPNDDEYDQLLGLRVVEVQKYQAASTAGLSFSRRGAKQVGVETLGNRPEVLAFCRICAWVSGPRFDDRGVDMT